MRRVGICACVNGDNSTDVHADGDQHHSAVIYTHFYGKPYTDQNANADGNRYPDNDEHTYGNGNQHTHGNPVNRVRDVGEGAEPAGNRVNEERRGVGIFEPGRNIPSAGNR